MLKITSITEIEENTKEPGKQFNLSEDEFENLIRIKINYESAIHLLKEFSNIKVYPSTYLRNATEYILNKEMESPTLTSRGFQRI